MTRFAVTLAAVPAALGCGVVCALGFVALIVPGGDLLAGDVADGLATLSALAMLMILAAAFGLGAGGVLGVIPSVVVVVAWPALQRRLGPARATVASALVVGTVVLGEMLVVSLRLWGESLGWALAVAGACAVVATGSAWLSLAAARRSARRTTFVPPPY